MSQQTIPQEFVGIHTASLLEAVSAQRNNALNEVANLAAEIAVLKATLASATNEIARLRTLTKDAEF